MYAGQTLAQLAIAQVTDPAGVLAELQARVARGGKSAKNAQKAIERMTSGASVAFPPAAPKAPKPAPASASAASAQVAQAKANLGINPNLPIAAAKAQAVATGPKATEKAVWAFVAKALKAGGYPVPRHVSKAARTGGLAPKVSA